MRTAFRQFLLSLMWGAVKRRFRAENPFVIAVTGSVGKTSTKEAIATMLEVTDRKVVKSIGNLGTDTGIPLSLLGFTEKVAGGGAWVSVIARSLFMEFTKPSARPYWVIEYSSERPGDLAFIGKRLPFDVGIFTSGGPVHMEYFKTQEAVTQELLDLLRFQRPGGYVIVHADDPFLHPLTWPEGVLKYGVTGLAPKTYPAHIRGRIGELSGTGALCTISPDREHSEGVLTEVLSAKLPVIGPQQLLPLVAAAMVGSKEGMSKSDLKKGLEAYSVPAGRGRLIAGLKGVTVVDDSANASPEAALAGLAMLRPWAKGRRTVAVLGTMNELGDQALAAHQEIAAAAGKAVDFLVAVGQYANQMLEAAQKAGMPTHRMLAFTTPEQLLTQIDQVIERNDIIYVKASQNGMRLERLVKRLMARPQQAPELLVRQSPAWKE